MTAARVAAGCVDTLPVSADPLYVAALVHVPAVPRPGVLVEPNLNNPPYSTGI